MPIEDHGRSPRLLAHGWDNPVLDWLERVLVSWLDRGRAAAVEVLQEHPPDSMTADGETHGVGRGQRA